MRKNAPTLILFILLGLLAATIITRLLAPVDALSGLIQTSGISWSPKADLGFINYNIHVELKLNVISLLGIACAIWIYRKL